ADRGLQLGAHVAIDEQGRQVAQLAIVGPVGAIGGRRWTVDDADGSGRAGRLERLDDLGQRTYRLVVALVGRRVQERVFRVHHAQRDALEYAERGWHLRHVEHHDLAGERTVRESFLGVGDELLRQPLGGRLP